MRTTAKFLFVSLLFIGQTISHLLPAQSVDFLEGVLFDAVTSEPVGFAQLRLKSNHLYIYSNSEGSFRFSKNSVFQSDSLIITAIGYKKYSITFEDLNKREIKNICLTPLNTSVNVRVSARDGKLNSIPILRRAIGNITTQDPVKPFSYISYYRDFKKKDSIYINLNEAIIQTFDRGFLSASASNIYRVIDFRKNNDFTRINFFPAEKELDSANLNAFDKLIPESVYRDQYGDELLTLSAQDPIRNFNTRSFPFVGIFSQNFIDNHNFSPPSEAFCDKLRLFKITFNGKTSIIGDSLLVSGAIYIQPENYSIHRFDYSCYNNANGKNLKKLFSINVEYGRDNTEDSLMYLKYISISRLYNVFDTEDKSYFRLRNSGWDIVTNINPTLTLSFNNRVDPVTARMKENFLIMIGKREIQIKNIQVVGENIYLRFKKEDVKAITDSIEVYVRVLKDQYGNLLDKRIPVEVYQHRELFVQDYTKSVSSPDSSISKDLSPLMETIPVSEEKEKYWMNTP